MKQIKIEKLTHEAFAPFGTFYDMTNPEGYALTGPLHSFYPDRIWDAYPNHVGFSPIAVRKPEKYIVDTVEYHTTTTEIIMPLDDDMILHVAPASAGTPVTDLTHAFRVPAHTMVQLKAAIWHLCPLPAEKDVIHCVIVLPECTYANDCTVVSLTEDQKFEIVE